MRSIHTTKRRMCSVGLCRSLRSRSFKRAKSDAVDEVLSSDSMSPVHEARDDPVLGAAMQQHLLQASVLAIADAMRPADGVLTTSSACSFSTSGGSKHPVDWQTDRRNNTATAEPTGGGFAGPDASAPTGGHCNGLAQTAPMPPTMERPYG